MCLCLLGLFLTSIVRINLFMYVFSHTCSKCRFSNFCNINRTFYNIRQYSTVDGRTVAIS